LNYGNPEKEDQMAELKEGIEGIAAACKGVRLKNFRKFATPVISGNVSLYNESKNGSSLKADAVLSKNGHIPPSAIICCIGKIDDAHKAVTMQIKGSGNILYMLGARRDELGGSEYYRINGHLGANVPKPDFAEAEKEIYAMVDAVADGLVKSAHDISEGGLAVTVAEMCFGGRGEGRIGAEIDLARVPGSGHGSAVGGAKGLREDIKMFSETGGFVVEVLPANAKKFLAVCKKYKLIAHEIGKTGAARGNGSKVGKKGSARSSAVPKIVFKNGSKKLVDLALAKAADAWVNGLREKL
jgi:phosphoribosylformylglycinamidine synthase